MADETTDRQIEDIRGRLDETLGMLEELTRRVQAEELPDEKELVVATRSLAEQLEEIRLSMEHLVGPIEREELRARLATELTPEEYQEWLEAEPQMMAFRSRYEAERPMREALGGGG